MSEHWIDDIFNKGLSAQEHKATEADWQGAREMLGFDKKRRRIPLWLWFGGVAALLLITMMTVRLSQDSDLSNDVHADAVIASEVPTIESVSGEEVRSGDKVSQDESTDSELIDNNTAENKASDKQKLNTTKAKIPTTEIVDLTNSKKKGLSTQVEKSNTPVTVSNGANGQVAVAAIIKTEQRTTIEVGSPTISSSPVLESDVLITAGNEQIDSKDQSAALVVVRSQEDGVNRPIYSYRLIPLITILPLELPANRLVTTLSPTPLVDVTSNSDMVKLLPENESNKVAFRLGLYGGMIVTDITPSLGLYGSMDFAHGLYANMGLGFNYQDNVSVFREGTVDVLNSSGNQVQVEAAENIVSDFYNLELPIHIGYRLGKHSLFAGALFDYPLYTKSAITSELRAMDLVDMSIDPASPMPSMTPDVVVEKVLSNPRGLNQITTQLRVGYGLSFHPRWTAELIGGYRLTSAEENSSTVSRAPSFSQGGEPIVPPNRYNASLIFRYRF